MEYQDTYLIHGKYLRARCCARIVQEVDDLKSRQPGLDIKLTVPGKEGDVASLVDLSSILAILSASSDIEKARRVNLLVNGDYPLDELRAIADQVGALFREFQ